MDCSGMSPSEYLLWHLRSEVMARVTNGGVCRVVLGNHDEPRLRVVLSFTHKGDHVTISMFAITLMGEGMVGVDVILDESHLNDHHIVEEVIIASGIHLNGFRQPHVLYDRGALEQKGFGWIHLLVPPLVQVAA